MREADAIYYRRRAQQQLAIASAAPDPAVKAIHLDLASRYAKLTEHAEIRGSATRPETDEKPVGG